MEASLEKQLLEDALKEVRLIKGARQAVMGPAARRQEAIFGLYASGLSIQAIAEKLGCSPAVVQNAVRQARAERPKIDRRENRVTFELHRAVAEKLDENPSEVISRGLRHVNVMRLRQRDRLSREWMSRWEDLLRGDTAELKRFILEPSADAEDMRQMSPFLGVLSNEERILAIKKASKSAA